jgi:hypothetical protein
MCCQEKGVQLLLPTDGDVDEQEYRVTAALPRVDVTLAVAHLGSVCAL